MGKIELKKGQLYRICNSELEYVETLKESIGFKIGDGYNYDRFTPRDPGMELEGLICFTDEVILPHILRKNKHLFRP